MTTIKKPPNLPECDLINTLIKKANKRTCDFNYIAQLDSFRKTVAAETKYIVQVFPEYTPHDIDNHLNNLFQIADTLLGKKHFESMNASELFLLCVGLYGHDWGMAVSTQQKTQLFDQISSGKESQLIDGLMKNERNSFLKFLTLQGYSFSQFVNKKEITDDLWSKYIRLTHAERSGERGKHFFLKEDQGIAESTDLICKGHTVKFEILEDENLYPSHTSVLGEPVNLKAITMYCRLIDLFDFADNRTPYIIWKYVAPENPVSKLEWAKHRALRPITCQIYNRQKRIIVNGSTDDHEVFAALNDLRSYCIDQIHMSQGIFARMNDSRHDFDIIDIDWQVNPEGFEAISIQFEFDRGRIFTILSDEIYQGNCYVFLRELLQNSIDAIKVRKKTWQDHGNFGEDFGTIKVIVNHQCDGDIEISWIDDGIGMDEHIIRNYLAVAGKSFYVSEEFEIFNKRGIPFDPISKYGIGILTCFLVADQIEITTYRDPCISPNSSPLKIIIPDKTRQFRIEKLTDNYPNVGTNVRVFVKGHRLFRSGFKDKLNVTEYLKSIAGFVEFPIIIEEGAQKTIILHPFDKPEEYIKKFGTSYKIFQLSGKYPWQDAIVPQDLFDAEKIFKEKTIDVKTDLGLDEYEGWITYLIPKNDDVEIISDNVSSSSASYFFKDNPATNTYNFRWNRNWQYDILGGRFQYSTNDSKGIGQSLVSSNNYRIYYNGIFIPNAIFPKGPVTQYRQLPAPSILINIKKPQFRLDLSRSHFTDNNWFSPVEEKICNQNFGKLIRILQKEKLPQRWYEIGKFFSVNDVDGKKVFESECLSNFPIPFIEENGIITFKELKDILSDEIITMGGPLDKETITHFSKKFIFNEDYNGLLAYWIGKPWIPLIERFPENFDAPESIAHAIRISTFIIKKFYRLQSIRFVDPPWDGDPPLIQEIFKPICAFQSDEDIDELFDTAINNPHTLSPAGIDVLNELFSSYPSDLHLPIFLPFPSNYDKYFAYGLDYLNLNHPLTQKLIQTAVHLSLLKSEGKFTPVQLGELSDIKYTFYDTDDELNYIDYSYLSKAISRFWKTCQKLEIINDIDIKPLIPSRTMFIPNTIGKNTIRYGKKIDKIKKRKKFGNVIQS